MSYTTTKQSPEEKVAAARFFISRKKPVFASVLQRVEVHLVEQGWKSPGGNEVLTALTDNHKNIWISSKFIEDMDVGGVTFLIMHELSHKMLKHDMRGRNVDTGRKQVDAQLPNVAQDFIINKIVADEIGAHNFPAQDGKDALYATLDNFWDVAEQSSHTGTPMAIFDPDITDDQSVEKIISHLVSTMPEPDQDDNGGDGDDQSGENSGEGEGGVGGSGDNDDPNDEKGDGDNGTDDQHDNPGEGDGAPDQPDQQDDPLGDALNNRYMNDKTDESPTDPETGEAAGSDEQASEDARTSNAVAQAIQDNPDKQIGLGSAMMQRIADAMMKPTINPRALLEKYVKRRTAKTDYTYRKPRKLGMAMDEPVILPTLNSEQLGDCYFFIDTSGSVGTHELNQYLSDMKAVMRVMKPANVHVVYIDTQVCSQQSFKRGQKIVLEPTGGGGTKFRPGFEMLKADQTKADLLVYMTDGYAWDKDDMADIKPPFPVIWIVYDGDRDFTASFGDIVHSKIKYPEYA